MVNSKLSNLFQFGHCFHDFLLFWSFFCPNLQILSRHFQTLSSWSLNLNNLPLVLHNFKNMQFIPSCTLNFFIFIFIILLLLKVRCMVHLIRFLLLLLFLIEKCIEKATLILFDFIFESAFRRNYIGSFSSNNFSKF